MDPSDASVHEASGEGQSKARIALVVALLLLAAYAVLQIQSLDFLSGLTGADVPLDPGDVPDRLWRVEWSIVDHQGHMVGTGLAFAWVLLFMALPEGFCRRAMLLLSIPLVISIVCWGIWALMNFGESSLRPGGDVMGFVALSGALSSIVCPIVAGAKASAAQRNGVITDRQGLIIQGFGICEVLWTIVFGALLYPLAISV